MDGSILNLHVAALQAQGFLDNRVDYDFPFRLAPCSSGEFDAEFESQRHRLVRTGVGVEIDGERRDLAPLLAALVSTPDFAPDKIRQLAEAGDHFYLPLADGRHLSLAADRHRCWRCMACGWAACSRMRQGRSKFRVRMLPLLEFSEREICLPLRRQSSPSRVCSRLEI